MDENLKNKKERNNDDENTSHFIFRIIEEGEKIFHHREKNLNINYGIRELVCQASLCNIVLYSSISKECIVMWYVM